MKKIRLITLFLLITALLITVGTAAADSSRNFRTHLSGKEEVPNPVDTNAQGQAIFQLSKDGTELKFKLIVANIDNVVGSHIHLAPKGQNGPIVVNLFGAPFVPDPGVTVNGTLAEGTITAADVVGPLGMQENPLEALVDMIKADNTYVNVHTVQHRGGEIRGQLD